MPISKARIEEIKRLIEKEKDGKTALQRLRELNDDLEKFERRITNKKVNG